MKTIGGIILAYFFILASTAYDGKDACQKFALSNNLYPPEISVVAESTWMRTIGKDGLVAITYTDPKTLESSTLVCTFKNRKTNKESVQASVFGEYSIDKMKAVTGSGINPFNFDLYK